MLISLTQVETTRNGTLEKEKRDHAVSQYILVYSCPIQLVRTYILLAKDIRPLGKFQPDSFKTERQVCVETDGQTDMARSTHLVMLIKNIYFIGSETSPTLRCKLLTEINIPSARV